MSNYVLKIITDKEKLNERTDEIDMRYSSKQVQSIISDLKDTLRANPSLEALCAPQIGQHYRIFCLRFAKNDIRAFVNPMIIKSKGSTLVRETNASIKDKEFIIPRAEEIQAAYYTPIGVADSNIFKDRAAAIFQQMVQMLDGVMLDDLGLEILPGFDEASDEEKAEIIKLYFNTLTKDLDQINTDIKNDETLSKVKDNMDFLTSVALGETELLHKEKDKEFIEAINNAAKE